MFNKLLSNLPYNPSLIGQVSFYARRLRQEASIRRLGVAFMAIAMVVQLFAVIAPPQPTLARAGNDIIPGGVSSQAELVAHCNANNYNFATIIRNFYGVTCANLAAGGVSNLNSRDHGGQLYSMGRLPYGKPGEQAVNIDGAGTFYVRPLWSWDTAGSSNYRVLGTRNFVGAPVFILFDCGNLVIIGAPKPPAPKPVCRDWYQGWGFWYKSPDGSVNHATQTTTTDPCKPQPPPPPPPKPCPYSPTLPANSPHCKPCPGSKNQTDTKACLFLAKSARNTTRNIVNANNTTAQPGDVINYTLLTQNKGKETIKGYVVAENLTDVLEYADVVDLHGGSKDAQHVVRWPAVNLAPNQTIRRFITVRVKNPIPQTPTPVSNPGSYDLVMTNVYGNTIHIKLPGSIIKTTEIITTTELPNTGPGTTLAIGFGVTALAGYFFARSRLMAKEVSIIKQEYAAGGDF